MSCEFCADDEDRLSDELSQSEVMSLVEAIIAGNVEEAMICLGAVFRDDVRAREWIAQARSRALRRLA